MATLRARKLLCCGYSGSPGGLWCKKVLFETTNEDLREINIRSWSRKLGLKRLSNEMVVVVIISEFRIWTWVKFVVVKWDNEKQGWNFNCQSNISRFTLKTQGKYSWIVEYCFVFVLSHFLDMGQKTHGQEWSVFMKNRPP